MNLGPSIKSLLLKELTYEAMKFKRFNLVTLLQNYKFK